MADRKHILVFRFSALGDVAMTVPVLRLLLAQHPGLQVTMVSDPFMAPLFAGIERLHFYGADTKVKYRGLGGLWKLSRRLRKEIAFDAVADLHYVLRTRILTFFLNGPQAHIDKGRAEKKSLTQPHNKQMRQLPSGFERYANVFEQLQWPVVLNVKEGYSPAPAGKLPVVLRSDKKYIGIAPFAKHAAKLYPPDKMKEVVTLLAAQPGIELFLLGSKKEAEVMTAWEGIGPNVYNMAGKFSFEEELAVIARLQLLVSMDSANMHLASLYGVPVVSVWGGTHPWLGFYGWGQDPALAVQTDLPCRPSSVFGNKPCPVHGEAGCMQDITPDLIVSRVMKRLEQ